MANEVRAQSSLQITFGQNQYRSPGPTAIVDNASEWVGPTPGYLSASQSGTVVNLSALTTPGWCFVKNLDMTNLISLEVGIYDPDTNEFYPMLEFLSGQGHPIRLSPFLGQEMGTGSPGTSPTGSGIQLMVRGVGGACPCIVDAFNV